MSEDTNLSIKSWDLSTMTCYLAQLGLLSFDDTVISSEDAGEGLMNRTIRVRSGQGRSYIVKQSPPYCEKFPEIAAPASRILQESRFYELAHSHGLNRDSLPLLLGTDPKLNIMVLEDLGEASDYEDLYRGKVLELEEVKELLRLLENLHSVSYEQSFANWEMRKLNHRYIFDYPYHDFESINLNEVCSGLREYAFEFLADPRIQARARELGAEYLSCGTHLIHGDFYPRSWVKSNGRIYMIDGEFGFLGRPEFDLGILIAHLILASQPLPLIEYAYQNYKITLDDWNPNLVLGFAGCEIIRRLLYVSQLPLNLDLRKRCQCLEIGKNLLIESSSLDIIFSMGEMQ